MAEAKTTAKSTTKKAAPAKPAGSSDLLNQLLEAGAHFGHQTRRWNPKMRPYIFTAKNSIYIIDLIQTAAQLEEAKKFVSKLAADGGEILFVGTKRQARPIIKAVATEIGMPYVTERWLGGMLTNFDTIGSRIKRLKKLEQQVEDGELAHLTKKERLDIDAEIEDLNRIFGGIRDMKGSPAAIFVVDAPKESIAIAEAHKLNIPVVAIMDTNADPDVIDVPIAANDDAIRSIKLITEQIGAAAKEGKTSYDAKTKVKEGDDE